MKDLTAKKDEGAEAYRTGDLNRAHTVWVTAGCNIKRMRTGSSWAELVEQGGEAFILNIACTKFDVGLNLAEAGISGWRASLKTVSISNVADAVPHESRARYGLRDARNCLEEGYFRPDYYWMPWNGQLAKLFYHYALSLRLWEDDSHAEAAMNRIDSAERLVPDDAVIREECRMIQQWVAGGGRGHLF